MTDHIQGRGARVLGRIGLLVLAAGLCGPALGAHAHRAVRPAPAKPGAHRAVPIALTSVPQTDLQALRWRSIGPARGGRVLTVAGIPGDARHFFFGAVDGGVWKTADAGRTWKPIFDGQPTGAIGALAIAPSNPNVMYVGSGEADMRSDIAHGNGMYKTEDGGANWSHIGLQDSRQIGKVIVDPANPDIVLVAALGHAYGPNPMRGVFRSTDGGAHWNKVLYKDESTGAIDLAFKPGDAQTVYAALWQTRRPPWNVYPPSNGPGGGLYISHDGGVHWSPVEGHGFAVHPGRIGLAVTPVDPARVFALVDAAGGEGGLYRSDDGGTNWTHITADKRIWQRGWYFTGITADPNNAGRVFVMNTIVLRSDDGGAHFIALKGDPTGDDFHAMWIDPTDSARQILGIDQGTIITNNGGATWSSWYNQPTAQIYHVATDNRIPYWVYGAQQDSGAVAVPSRTSSYDGITMQNFHEPAAGGESDMIAPDPDDPDTVYGGRVDKLDLRTGQTRNIDPTLAYPAQHYRGAWTLPLQFSKAGRKTLYFANQRLFATTDGGEHWTPISPDLTRPDPGVPATLDAVTAADDVHAGARKGVIYTITPSSLSAALLWVGTDDGLVWKTGNGGKQWTNVTPAALSAWSKAGGIEASHFAAGTAYLAVDRHRLDDDAPYLYRTRDGGMSWARIDAGLPAGAFVNVVREDPKRPGLLYAGTEKGFFISFDDGGHWQSLQQNLPQTSVRDIKVRGDDLVIATHGRGFWIMDGITALRQMDHADAQLTLFAPGETLRLRPSDFGGTPMPRDEPLSANPPDGAYIDYILPAGVVGPATLSITGAHGELVRTISSTDPRPSTDPATLGFAPEWVVQPWHLSTEAGMQRYVWDLRYPALEPAKAGAPQSDGAWAPPGVYTLTLSAGGRTRKTTLTVKPDPRRKLAPAAYQAEFALTRQIEAAGVEAGRGIEQAKALLAGLSERKAKASAAMLGVIEAGQRAISEVSGVALATDPRNSMGAPPKSASSLVAIAGRLEALEKSADGADAAPSPDAKAGFAAVARILGTARGNWHAWLAKDLPALNAKLSAAGLTPLKAP